MNVKEWTNTSNLSNEGRKFLFHIFLYICIVLQQTSQKQTIINQDY